MLQRIQTLYLLAIAGLMAALCFVPMANYTVDGVPGEVMAFDYWYIGALFALCALVPFVTIWLFKDRYTQIRLLAAEIVLLLGAQGFALWYALRMTNLAEAAGRASMSGIGTPVFFPLVCIILSLLAIRAIWKDEKLVRSLDRIR